MTAIGDFLKEARIKKKLSQRELATELGYDSGQIISNWERGVQKPTPKKLPDLCRSLDVRIDDVTVLLMVEIEQKVLEKCQE